MIIEKDIFRQPHMLNEVSVTVYMNVISYSLICWVYYGLLVPSPLIPLQLLLKMKPDLDPTMKIWYKLLYYMMGSINLNWVFQYDLYDVVSHTTYHFGKCFLKFHFSQAKHILKILWCSSLDAIVKVMNINEERELSLCCF